MIIEPKLDILPDTQKELWPQLKDVPQKYVLYGGTAIALRYGHRASVDFDFFSTDQKDIRTMAERLPFIRKNQPSEEFLKRPDNARIKVYNHAHIDYFLEPLRGRIPFIDEDKSIVKVTFANNTGLIAGAIKSPDEVSGNWIKIASPLDLMAAKILAMANRTAYRDFVDIAELIKHGISLQKGFEAAFAISRISPEGAHRINYAYLKEDLKAKTVTNILPDRPECVEIIREAAANLDLEKVLNTKLKAQPVNYREIDMGNGMGMGR